MNSDVEDTSFLSGSSVKTLREEGESLNCRLISFGHHPRTFLCASDRGLYSVDLRVC